MFLVCTCAVVAVVVWMVRSLALFGICLFSEYSFRRLFIYVFLFCGSDGIGFIRFGRRAKSKRLGAKHQNLEK